MNTEPTTTPTTKEEMPDFEGYLKWKASQEPTPASHSDALSENDVPEEAEQSLDDGGPGPTDTADQLHQHQDQDQAQDQAQEATTPIPVDGSKRQTLVNAFHAAIANPRFWAKENRYDVLLAACSVPVFDDRSLQMYYIHADSDLNAAAAKKSMADEVPAVLPTEEEIKAEAWRRWVASETESVAKGLNKVRREEAKLEGRKFIQVPAAEVQVIVAESEARLRASENG